MERSLHTPQTGLSLSPKTLLLLLGLCALYIPTITTLSHTLWQTDEQGHGPLILAAACWIFYEIWKDYQQPASRTAHSGWFILLLGLLLYIVGRSQSIALLEITSAIPILTGSIALLYGWNLVWKLRFPLFFLLFVAPVPGFIIDATTGPLKVFISTQAENILYLFNYPVARSGVSLSVGQYQLLVADACSGLNSMVSLIAVGLFYLYMAQRKNTLHNLILLVVIPLIAVAANLVRVITLCLVTYYYGDEVGQGFIHSATGVLLFAVSLSLLFLVDGLLSLIFKSK